MTRIASHLVSQRPFSQGVEETRSRTAQRITALAIAIIGSLASFLFLPPQIAAVVSLGICTVSLLSMLNIRRDAHQDESSSSPSLYSRRNPTPTQGTAAIGVLPPALQRTSTSTAQPAGFVDGTPVSNPGNRISVESRPAASPAQGASANAVLLAAIQRTPLSPSVPTAQPAGSINGTPVSNPGNRISAGSRSTASPADGASAIGALPATAATARLVGAVSREGPFAGASAFASQTTSDRALGAGCVRVGPKK